MKRYMFASYFLVLASWLAACARPTPEPAETMIRPGYTIGGMTLKTAPDESHAKQDIWSACSPIITSSDPAIIRRECSVPQLPYLFIGLGDVAQTREELLSTWKSETWEMYLNDQQIDLSAFGTIDIDIGLQLISWNIMLENPTPGVYKLRYIIHNFEGSKESKDATWMITIGEPHSSPTPHYLVESHTYPPLSSIIDYGQHPHTSRKAQLNFLLYLPDQYGKDPQTKWPLILYLHGSGKLGSNLDHLRTGPLPSNLESQSDFPFIVVSPQLSGETGKEYWPQEAVVDSLFALLDEIQSTYAVDPNRIYLTGVSLGGNGVWEIGLRFPKRFAALVPVMGFYGYPYTVPDNICDLKEVPIWAFHGAKDDLVPLDAEAGLVNALKACGGNIQFTVYPDAHHDVEPQAYATQDLYNWLLEQRLNGQQ